jgi:putative transposase
MGKITKTALAQKLGVSRAALYYRPKRMVTDEEMKKQIVAVMSDHPAYGHRRISWTLGINKKAIIRVMKINGLKPIIRRGGKPAKPGDLSQPETRVNNMLKLICPLKPNVIWAGDFTYLWFIDQFWYVATVIDVFHREIVGWHIANHHTANLIIEAFNDAMHRSQTVPTFFHSDQGSEYVSSAYESLLAKYRVKPSHSRKSSPWQNGYQESFYSQFKLELGNLNRFQHVGELIEAVHRQIRYYNHHRIHSALKMPPVIYKLEQTQKHVVSAAY